MEIVMPEIGVIFWTIFAFLIVAYLLRRFAWKPILKMLNERNLSINEALKSADLAHVKMEQLEAKNKVMLADAKIEREKLLEEARKTETEILNKAREEAKKDASRMMDRARKEIKAERETAFLEMKNEIVDYSVEIAEKILRREIKDQKAQKEIAERYIDEIKEN